MPIKTKIVTTEHILDEAITQSKIADGAITTTKITDLSITTPKLAANSVTTEKVGAGAITAEKIAALAITAEKIAAEAITAEKIAAKEITAMKLSDDVWGDLSQSVRYVQRALQVAYEYEDTQIQSDLDAGTFNNIVAQGIEPSLRIKMTRYWDDGVTKWDSGAKWDIPTYSSGTWESASQDIGSLETGQLSVWLFQTEDLASATSIKVEAIYSTDGTNWGTNDPDLNDGVWETLTEHTAGEQYYYVGTILIFRYFKIRITLTTTDTNKRIIITSLMYRINLVNLVGYKEQITIAEGGTIITYQGFDKIPSITITPVGDTPLVPLISSKTLTQATVHLFDLSGVDVGGVADICIIGA